MRAKSAYSQQAIDNLPPSEGYAGEAGIRLSQGIPLGREATVDVRNAHLSYVVTW